MAGLTTVAAIGVAAVFGVALAGCGGTTVVDTAKLSRDIQSTLDENAVGTVKIEKVDCPKDPVAEAGKEFTCSFELADGSSGEVTVKVRDDEGAARWDVTRPASGQVEQEILADNRGEAEEVRAVDCDDPIEVGGRSGCIIRFANGVNIDVTVTTDDDGRFRWRSR